MSDWFGCVLPIPIFNYFERLLHSIMVSIERSPQTADLPSDKMDVSVSIRVYNSQATLPLLLDKLAAQVNTEDINWEVVVVDNNSTDNTANIVKDYQASWDYPFSLKYFLEPKQGAIFARQRAILESRGEIIIFLDDDNLPGEDWVFEAYAFAQAHPKAGVFGSRIQGEFEVEPPKDFGKIQGFLAIKEYGDQPRQFNADRLDLPAGAGMAIRKQVWQAALPKELTLKGPIGNSLASKGEDFESMMHISRAGWEIWYNPKMRIYHHIPAWRMEKAYLMNLVHCSGLNVCTLRLVTARGWKKPLVAARIMLGSLRKIVKHIIEHRGHYKDDLVASCELEFFRSSLMSPFNHLKTMRAAKR